MTLSASVTFDFKTFTNTLYVSICNSFGIGKKRMYGDTFPHYWSSLTANVYYDYARLTRNNEYMKKAEASYRGTLSMFNPNGSASCAYVYPVTINGKDAGYYDPYANDQD